MTLFIFYFILSSVKSQDFPKGHLEPLGHHCDSSGHIEVRDKMIPPKMFWETYCEVGKPVLFTNVAKSWPAFTKWSNEYLKKNFGKLRVKIESKYEKDHSPIGDLGLGQDSLEHFIDTYQTNDKYMVSQLPHQMSSDVLVPQCLLCGTLYERILEANIWMSSGNTRSVLHSDADNAINCLLTGTKSWIMIDPIYTHLLPVEVEYGDPYGGFTSLDVDAVDLIKFPELQDVPWHYVNMSAGDCLFLPKDYWHQVRSYGLRNLAVSILFARLQTFDDFDCPSSHILPPIQSLEKSPMIWVYDGFATQGMGNPDPFELNETVAEICTSNDGLITVESLRQFMIDTSQTEEYKGTLEIDLSVEDDEDEQTISIVIENKAHDMLKILDHNDDGNFFCSNESSLLTIKRLKLLAEAFDFDPGNTDEYEFWLINPSAFQENLYSLQVRSKENFVLMFRRLQGSLKNAEIVFKVLDSNDDSFISNEEMSGHLDEVLDMFKRYKMPEVKPSKKRVNDFINKDEL